MSPRALLRLREVGPAMEITLETRVKVPETTLVQKLEGETVLLDLESEIYFGLNPTGGRMLELLRAGSSVEEACQQLLDEFDVELERLRADRQALVEKLAAKGLVHVDP